ncbi:hypothetical protein EDEG_02390 [Edhazardia aedis USNM 41457]|uniref:Uncharacterized protein n=1 Tax=Edhazardia aedis (strain USNM 41457) TaxID=1003232 RepID=J9DPF2_EDHAE|nr:hypothetical protein EDEG_02390 [Edhazardia aedis USNM 41457]|eukprot:EJW03222.1 hypothetical protein EDEG_02390 [Edhazardia aedis USNM 41457]
MFVKNRFCFILFSSIRLKSTINENSIVQLNENQHPIFHLNYIYTNFSFGDICSSKSYLVQKFCEFTYNFVNKNSSTEDIQSENNEKKNTCELMAKVIDNEMRNMPGYSYFMSNYIFNNDVDTSSDIKKIKEQIFINIKALLDEDLKHVDSSQLIHSNEKNEEILKLSNEILCTSSLESELKSYSAVCEYIKVDLLQKIVNLASERKNITQRLNKNEKSEIEQLVTGTCKTKTQFCNNIIDKLKKMYPIRWGKLFNDFLSFLMVYNADKQDKENIKMDLFQFELKNLYFKVQLDHEIFLNTEKLINFFRNHHEKQFPWSVCKDTKFETIQFDFKISLEPCIKKWCLSFNKTLKEGLDLIEKEITFEAPKNASLETTNNLIVYFLKKKDSYEVIYLREFPNKKQKTNSMFKEVEIFGHDASSVEIHFSIFHQNSCCYNPYSDLSKQEHDLIKTFLDKNEKVILKYLVLNFIRALNIVYPDLQKNLRIFDEISGFSIKNYDLKPRINIHANKTKSSNNVPSRNPGKKRRKK